MNSLGPNAPLINKSKSRNLLTTPSLIVDLDAFELNITAHLKMAENAGLQVRPHSKTHKCSEIAKIQIAGGAIGICCATIHETEVMMAAGIKDILVTSPIVGEPKMRRLIELASRNNDLKIVVDNQDNAQSFAAMAEENGIHLNLLVDIDVGMQRTGVHAIGDIIDLAKLIENSQSLNFYGVQAYSGKVQHIETYSERDQTYRAQIKHLTNALSALEQAGLQIGIVTGGGTGTHAIDYKQKIFTEHQSGSYIFMDVEYNAVDLTEGSASPFQTSLFMQCAVVSANASGFVTIDGGYKCFATDGPLPQPNMLELPDASYERFGDEHGKLLLGKTNLKPAIGDPITLITPHCDPTVNLHNYLHCVRGDTLIDIWPIDARGVL